MKRPESPDLASLPADQVQWVNAVCSEFEDRWRSATRPTVKEFAHRAGKEAGPIIRLVLLRELLTSELELRTQDARAHDIDAYRACFSGPSETDVVDSVLGEEARADNRRRFQVSGLHARGGLGELFVAHDSHLDRAVALKRMRPELAEDESIRNRFVGEAEITGRLEHPNIAPVYDLGLDFDHLPYYAMRFIEGQPLNEAIARFRKEHPAGTEQGRRLIELRKLLRSFNAVCDAVAFAHSRGIVHRDIKPANVILGRFGETILVDWGLAKGMGAPEVDSPVAIVRDREPGRNHSTELGSMLGTLPYMSPEQARSATEAIGAASDVYSLGATLYHLLTGRPPFAGTDLEELRRKVISGDFQSPRRVDSAVPRALDAIAVKAMAREPADRYPSATALAADIEHWLADEAVAAWREPLSTRVGRKIRRHRTLAAGTGAGLLVGLLGLAGLAVVLAAKNSELDGRRQQAVAQRNRAERARDVAFKAVQTIILTDKDPMLTEEARPYRAMLLDESLRLSKELTDVAEDDERSAKLRAEALMMKAKILAEKGDRSGAYDAGKQAVQLLDGLVANKPADIPNREALAHLLHHLATVATSLETGQVSARRSREIYLALLRENPRSPAAAGWTGEAVIDLHNIGHAYFQESESKSGADRIGLLRKAADTFREGERLCANQFERGDEANHLLMPLAYSERYLCRVYRTLAGLEGGTAQAARDLIAAIQCGENGIAHFKILAGREPGQYQYHRELQLSQRELGRLFLDGGKWAEAIRFFTAARETVKSMVEPHRNSVSRSVAIQEELAMVDFDLINALSSDVVGNDKLIRELVEQAYEICERVDVAHPLTFNLRKTYAYVCYAKADFTIESTGVSDVILERKAEKLLNQLFTETHGDYWSSCYLVICRLELADALESGGQRDEVVRFETGAIEIARGHADLCVQTAYNYAVSAQAVLESPSKLNPEQRQKLNKRYSRRVVPMLREAVAAGFKDGGRLRNDPAFRQFQRDPEFRSVVRDADFPSQPLAPH
jgi:tRNA A-37 threonylcarbamoyl transferase component Bud32/HEPN domain-containing protein